MITLQQKKAASLLFGHLSDEEYKDVVWLILSIDAIAKTFTGLDKDIERKNMSLKMRLIDSLNKQEGVLRKYYKVISNNDGTITPFRGNILLMDMLKINDDNRKIVYPDYEERVVACNTDLA